MQHMAHLPQPGRKALEPFMLLSTRWPRTGYNMHTTLAWRIEDSGFPDAASAKYK